MAGNAPIDWLALHFPQPFNVDHAIGLIRTWAADRRSPALVLEASGEEGVVSYRLGAPRGHGAPLAQHVQRYLPGSHVADAPDRLDATQAGRLKISTRHRALRIAEIEAIARALTSALTASRAGERLVIQIVLGPRRVPLAVPTSTPASAARPLRQTILHGNGGTIDGERRSALRDKVADHGFACVVRLGATALDPQRGQRLLSGLMAGLRTAENGGLRLRLVRSSPRPLNSAAVPWWYGLRLNVSEVLIAAAWPVGKDPLPGQPRAHPKYVRALPQVRAHDRVLVESTAPGDVRPLGLSAQAALQHLHLIGATGAGKSTVIVNAVVADMRAGRSGVVVDPKGDLIRDILERVPDERRDDIVVLDPADRSAPVGMNPMAPLGGDAQLAADGVLTVFKGLYPDAWGPRTQDVLHASLLTLARRGDSSLLMLPLLLTNDGFRRSLTANLNDPVALEPFWQWFEDLSDASRQAAIAPALSRLRTLLLRPGMRAVLGQIEPRFDMQQVFTGRKWELISLAKGQLGLDASSLLGSLIVSRLWQTILTRSAVPAAQRHPVMIYIDEVQDYLHLDTGIADVFAQSRGYGAGWTVAHQYLDQLPRLVRSGLLANARSRIVFTVSGEDASVFARSAPELTAEDFASLGQYETYASLLSDGAQTPYASARTLPPPASIPGRADELRRLSRERFGRSLDQLEAEFAALLNPEPPADNLGRRPRRQS